MSKLAYLVQRYEDGEHLTTYPERVFLTQDSAEAFCRELDPQGKGVEYWCPCGCGDAHYRSWSWETVVLEDK